MATARRQEKMKSLLRRLVSEFLLRMDFKNQIISVMEVRISENLRFAKIFLSVYPVRSKTCQPANESKIRTSNGIYPEKESEKILESVKSKTGEIKKYLASKVKIKFMPEMEFKIDEGEKNRQRIEEILKKNTA